MKNYKAEIFNKLMGKMVIGQMPIEYVEQISEEMCVLIREIVKEGIISADNWTHTHPIHVENIACKSCMRHDICSEILSNIEEMIK